MKTIVTVKRFWDGCTSVYEVPDGAELKSGYRVLVEYNNTECAGVATQDPIEVADDIVEYFTAEPLLKITAIVTPIAEPQDDPE